MRTKLSLWCLEPLQWNGRSPRFVRQRSSQIRKARISVGRIEERQSCPLDRWYVSSETLVSVRHLGDSFLWWVSDELRQGNTCEGW